MIRRNFVTGTVSLVLAPAIGSRKGLERAGRASVPEAIEEIISVTTVNRHPDVLETVHSRVTFPPESVWRIDPDLGPLSLSVEKGALTVLLGGGLARIEREANPLVFEQIGPLTREVLKGKILPMVSELNRE